MSTTKKPTAKKPATKKAPAAKKAAAEIAPAEQQRRCEVLSVFLRSRRAVQGVVTALHKQDQIFNVFALRTPEDTEPLEQYSGHPFNISTAKERAAKFMTWCGKTMNSAKVYRVDIFDPSRRAQAYMNRLNIAMNVFGAALGEAE